MTHLSPTHFRRLYDAGSDDEIGLILDHLAWCDLCLDRLDRWSMAEAGLSGSSPDLVASAAFWPKLRRRIRREEAAQAVLRFGLHDIVMVIVLLLQPWFGSSRRRTRARRNRPGGQVRR